MSFDEWMSEVEWACLLIVGMSLAFSWLMHNHTCFWMEKYWGADKEMRKYKALYELWKDADQPDPDSQGGKKA